MQTLKSTVINILIYLHVKLKGMIWNCICSVHSLIHSFVHANIVCLLYGGHCSRPWAHSYEQHRQDSLPSQSYYSSERRHNKHIGGRSDKYYGLYFWGPHSKDVNIRARLKESSQKGEGVRENVKNNWKETRWSVIVRTGSKAVQVSVGLACGSAWFLSFA